MSMSDHQPIAPATAELATLDALVGTWNWNGRSSDGSFEVTGQTRFEWLTGGP
jgi:hypothetical protein